MNSESFIDNDVTVSEGATRWSNIDSMFSARNLESSLVGFLLISGFTTEFDEIE